MSRKSRKEKLEAGLQSLFSETNQPAETEELVPPETQEPEAITPPSEPLPTASPPVEPAQETVMQEVVEPSSQLEAAVPASDVDEVANKDEERVVVFTLADEYYAVDVATVKSISNMQHISVVPHAPWFVEGVTILRSMVLPVVNLRKRFGLPIEEATKNTRILVVEIKGTTVGMIVDAVTEVLRVPEESIEPPSPLVMTVDSAFISGIAKANDRLVILLDLSKVLTLQEQADLQALSATA